MKKSLLIFFALFLSMIMNAMDFARDSKALCLIAVPETMSEYEKLALHDLENYLRRMTGAEFKQVPESEVAGKPAIYLGRTKFAQAHGVAFDRLAKEEWIIKTVGKDLILTGGTPVGAFYAVWALFEKAGCYALDMETDLVPAKPDLSLSNIDEQKKPRIDGRCFYDGFAVQAAINGIDEAGKKAYNLWMLRNKINGFQHRLLPPLYSGDYFNITQNPPFHSLCLYVDPALYFNSHPEYFGMNEKGVRQRPIPRVSGSLCMTNPEVQKITLEKLRSMIKNDRAKIPKEKWPVLYDISILDLGPHFCLCPKCREFAQKYGKTGLLIHFLNLVAKEIAKEYPDIVIRTLGCYLPAKGGDAPVPEKNIAFQVTDLFVSCDCYHPLNQPAYNKEAMERFTAWKNTGAKLMVWDYWNIYYVTPRVETVIDTLRPDIKFFSDIGVVSLFIESSRHFYHPQTFRDLEYFVAAHLMVDPDADVEKLTDIFLDGYYGKAAPDVKKLLTQVRADIKKRPARQPGLRPERWFYMTPQYMLGTYKLLKNAAAKTPASSLQRRHVHDLMIPVMWYVIEKQLEYMGVFEKAGIKKKELQAECRQYCLDYINRINGSTMDTENMYSDTRKSFENNFVRITLPPLPRPEIFSPEIPEEQIIVFETNAFRPEPKYNSRVVKDPDSPTGKANMSAGSSPLHNGVRVYENPKTKWKCAITAFGCSGKDMVIQPVPQDEKYHWYKIADVKIKEKSYFWGHLWFLMADISPAYRRDDGQGLSKANLWDCWFLVKFTGPAYVKGSKKQNAIWCANLVLVKAEYSPGNISFTAKVKDGDNMSRTGFAPHRNSQSRLRERFSGSPNAFTIRGLKKAGSTICGKEHIPATARRTLNIKVTAKGSGKIYLGFYTLDARHIFIAGTYATREMTETFKDYSFKFKIPAKAAKIVKFIQPALIIPPGCSITLKDMEYEILQAN